MKTSRHVSHHPLMIALASGLLAVSAAGAVPNVSHAQELCFGRSITNSPTSGDDVIEGTPGNDVLGGGPGNDVIKGLAGNDRLCGNEGNDRILGNSGALDRIDGGPGDDELSGGEFFSPITCGPGAGDTDILSGRELIYGRDGNDSLLGTRGDDLLDGGSGNDCLMGVDGNDLMLGHDGADILWAGAGDDMAIGGDDYDQLGGEDGNDNLFAADQIFPVPTFPQTCDQSGAFAAQSVPESGDKSRTGENVTKHNFLSGGDGYDKMYGADRVDFMQGEERGDDLYGFGGADVLRGGRASDCLQGGLGPDELDDSDVNNTQPDDIDTLWGGSGVDILNAKDGDSLDALEAGSDLFNACTIDTGDSYASCFFLLP